jgi:hypothetical protein
MNLIFYKKDSLESFSIRPFINSWDNKPCLWLENKLGEGGQFKAEEIENVIYEALEKYFAENY